MAVFPPKGGVNRFTASPQTQVGQFTVSGAKSGPGPTKGPLNQPSPKVTDVGTSKKITASPQRPIGPGGMKGK